jgi:hypothetical protein
VILYYKMAVQYGVEQAARSQSTGERQQGNSKPITTATGTSRDVAAD